MDAIAIAKHQRKHQSVRPFGKVRKKGGKTGKELDDEAKEKKAAAGTAANR